MNPADNNTQNRHNLVCKQPISCPWINSQPYPSTVNKNKICASTSSQPVPNIPITLQQRTSDKTCPSLLHSSSQFFYFLRLMQLFPETHPATLHTVLTLCKNDFFSTVDKLLYAKRCKSLYHRSQVVVNKKCTPSRSHPYCCPNEQCKSCVHNENKNVHKKAESSDTKSLDSSNRGYSFNVSGTEGEEKCKHNSNNPGNDSELKGLNLTINSVSKISEDSKIVEVGEEFRMSEKIND